jgi:septation ring formation regulator EzrA
MIFLDLIPKSAYAALIAVLMVTTVKLHWDKSGLVVDVAVGKTTIAQLEGAIDKANAKSAQISATLTTQVLKAQNDAKKREATLLADARDANNALDSLRLSTASTRAAYRLSGPTATASYQQFSASLDALDQCAKEYSDVAAVADQYGSDIQTLVAAWPINPKE